MCRRGAAGGAQKKEPQLTRWGKRGRDQEEGPPTGRERNTPRKRKGGERGATRASRTKQSPDR